MPWREPAFLCLALSAALFMVGGAFGLFVDGADTRTPAHYHGVIAAITLAFMGLFYTLLLPALNRPAIPGRAMTSQIFLFAGGQLMACIGLFLAGAPRKTAGAAQGLQDAGAMIGMAMNGFGALIAIIGGIMFIWIAAAALLRTPRANKGHVVSPLQP
jgi:heme/copper-type cytochrome/quinol oxidase subunit 1